MVQFDGGSAAMEAHLRTLAECEVVEIANSGNGPYENKAKAELARRKSEQSRRTFVWERVENWAGIVVAIVAIAVTVVLAKYFGAE